MDECPACAEHPSGDCGGHGPRPWPLSPIPDDLLTLADTLAAAVEAVGPYHPAPATWRGIRDIARRYQAARIR